MDRVQPGAQGSRTRNIEFGETASQYSPGWVVPADDPTLSAIRFTSLDEETFEAFDATYSETSLTVTIEPGEGYVDAWVARDEPTEIELEADTAGQIVVLGWNPDAAYDSDEHATRDDADQVIVGLEDAANIDDDDPVVPIWSFDTDADGVVDATDERYVGTIVEAGKPTVATIEDLPSAEEYPLGTEFFVLEENQSYEVTQDE